MRSVCLLLLLCSVSWAQTQLRVFNLRAKGLPQDLLGITDGYVKVFFRSELLGKTDVLKNNANPWWPEDFIYVYAKPNDPLRLEVHDKDLIFDDLVGTCFVQVQSGTYEEHCDLEKGGALFYDYTLG